MIRRLVALVGLMALGCLLPLRSCVAQDTFKMPSEAELNRIAKEVERSQFKGIKYIATGLGVSASDIFATDANLPKEADMTTWLELSLRRNKIPLLVLREVSTLDENTLNRLKEPHAVIQISTRALKVEGDSLYAYFITVDVTEMATLKRTNQDTHAVTWSRSSLGYAGEGVVKDTFKEIINRYLDEFANLYLAANP